MTNLIPVNARNKIEAFRDSLGDFLARWRPGGDDGDTVVHGVSGSWPSAFATWGGPEVDLEDTGSDLRVTAELPGLDANDLSIEVRDRRLVIQGEKRQDRQEKADGVYYSERRYGSFSRSIPLPCEVKADKAKAEHRRGVLSLRLPKAEGARAKRIAVKVH